MKLGPVQLIHYFDPSQKVGCHIVHNHDRFQKIGDPSRKFRLKESTVHRIWEWCSKNPKIRRRDWMLKSTGAELIGVSEQEANSEVFLYNPDNLPGVQELATPFLKDEEGRLSTSAPCLIPFHSLVIDKEVYVVPSAYFSYEDLEEIT
jgi:hypothetical protein